MTLAEAGKGPMPVSFLLRAGLGTRDYGCQGGGVGLDPVSVLECTRRPTVAIVVETVFFYYFLILAHVALW